MQVRWYQSLRFKLFAILAALLTLAVAAFAVNSGTQFTSVLNEQIRERIATVSARSQTGVENAITQWRSVTSTLVQSILNPRLPQTERQSQVDSFANSNAQIVVFDAYVQEPGRKPYAIALGASVSKEQASLRAFRRADLLAKVRGETVRLLESLAAKKPAEIDKSELFNLEQATGAPLLLIATPFRLADKRTVWAMLVVLSEGLQASVESSPRSRTWVLRGDGTPILWPPGRKLAEARAYAADPPVRKALQGASQNLTFEGARSDGEPYVTAYSKGREHRLVVFVEQDAGEGRKLLYHRLGRFALLGFIVAWGALGLIYIAMGRATRSIVEAVYATMRIASGDLAARVRTSGRDEVGMLGAAVNHMAEQIGKLLEMQAVAARQEAELRTAQAFQATLFPKRVEFETRFRVSGHYRSASECAGDWWSYYRLSATRTLVLVADATGHGAPAALVGATAFGFFENYARSVMAGLRQEMPPVALLQAFNEMLWQSGSGQSSMTMILLLLDSETETLTYVNAGHVPSILIPRDPADERLSRRGRGRKGRIEAGEGSEPTAPAGNETQGNPVPAGKRAAPLLGAGSVLGYGPDPQFEEKMLALRAGDRFFLYTDGLVECANAQGQSIKPMRLREMLGGLADIQGDAFKETFVARMEAHFGTMALDDDVTVVVVEYLDEVLSRPGDPLLPDGADPDARSVSFATPSESDEAPAPTGVPTPGAA